MDSVAFMDGLSILLSTLAVCGVFLLALWLWITLAARALRLPELFDEVHQVDTPDGATITLCRLRARGEPSGAPPVLLCHGLAMNRRAFALLPERSFAHALAATGRDVWALELRGASEGRHPRSLRLATFDTYARIDVPLALAQVRAITGAAEVDWVGFSMGGMLAYAHLGARGGAGVRRLVTIGSPVHFHGLPIRRGVGLAPLLFAPARLLVRTPFRFLSLLAAPLIWSGVPRAMSQGLRGDHYNSASLRRVMANALADVPMGVSIQFVRWIREGCFDSDDHADDYFGGLGRVRVPTLVIAGSRDRLALPDAVLEAARRIPAPSASRVVGKETGATRNYDHLDLILGDRAVEEVFPLVRRWLDAEEPSARTLA
jgi:pimeloyl-ACP methyl ester carboxylesterase